MAYWIKVNYERSEYVIDLDRISAFSCAQSGRITFWLPDSSIPIIINRQSDSEGYQRVLNYINQVCDRSLRGTWVRIIYDRSEYIIDLTSISSFCYSPHGKLTFWLPDSSIPIIINKQGDPDGYEKITEFVKNQTGQTF